MSYNKNLKKILFNAGIITGATNIATITNVDVENPSLIYYNDETDNLWEVIPSGCTGIIDRSGYTTTYQYYSFNADLVDTHTTSITFSGETTINCWETAVSTLAIINQDSRNVTTESYLRSATPAVASTGGTYGQIITAHATGTTVISAYHEDGVSATTTITVENIVNSLTASTSTSAVTTGTVYAVTITDQESNEIQNYCSLLSNAYATYNPSNAELTILSVTGTTAITFMHNTVAPVYGNLDLYIKVGALTVTGVTTINGYVTGYTTLTVTDQFGVTKTNACTYTTSNPTIATTGGTYGNIIRGLATGTTVITATETATGFVGTATITVSNIVSSMSIDPVSASTATGTTVAIIISDQNSNDISEYCALTLVTGGTITYDSGTKDITVDASVTPGTYILQFVHTVSSTTANFTLIVV